jgi:hypothetical protein
MSSRPAWTISQDLVTKDERERERERERSIHGSKYAGVWKRRRPQPKESNPQLLRGQFRSGIRVTWAPTGVTKEAVALSDNSSLWHSVVQSHKFCRLTPENFRCQEDP